MKKSRIRQSTAKEEIVRWLAGLIAGKKVAQGDWLLVKGSRGMRMETIVESLTEKVSQER